MKPKEVKREKDLLKLSRETVATPRTWMLFNDQNQLVICNQKKREKSTGKVYLTRRDFQKFVDWWEGKR